MGKASKIRRAEDHRRILEERENGSNKDRFKHAILPVLPIHIAMVRKRQNGKEPFFRPAHRKFQYIDQKKVVKTPPQQKEKCGLRASNPNKFPLPEMDESDYFREAGVLVCGDYDKYDDHMDEKDCIVKTKQQSATAERRELLLQERGNYG